MSNVIKSIKCKDATDAVLKTGLILKGAYQSVKDGTFDRCNMSMMQQCEEISKALLSHKRALELHKEDK